MSWGFGLAETTELSRIPKMKKLWDHLAIRYGQQ